MPRACAHGEHRRWFDPAEWAMLAILLILVAAAFAAMWYAGYGYRITDKFLEFVRRHEDIAMHYVERASASRRASGAAWDGLLIGLAAGVAVPAKGEMPKDFDRWAAEGVLMKAEVRFSAPVVTENGPVRAAYVYRLRRTRSGLVRCPVESFSEIYRNKVKGRSSLRFNGHPLRVDGLSVSWIPYLKAYFSDYSRLALKKIFLSSQDAKYLRGEPQCSLKSGHDFLRSLYRWTAFLLDEGLLAGIVMADGRPAVLERPGLSD